MAALNVVDATNLYRESGKEIGLVILDLMMPRMGGAECLKVLLKVNPIVKAIIASGHSSQEGAEEYLESGA